MRMTNRQYHRFEVESQEHLSTPAVEGPLPLAKTDWLAVARPKATRVLLASEEELDREYTEVTQVEQDLMSFRALAGVLEQQAVECRFDGLVAAIWRDHQLFEDAANRLRLRLNPIH